MRNIVTATHSRIEFDSLAEIRETVRKRFSDVRTLQDMDLRSNWYGGVASHAELFRVARVGWQEQAAETLNVAEQAVNELAREYPTPQFHACHDVTGSDVDVARYLSGEPENMVSYQLADNPYGERVVTLAANVTASSKVTSDVIIARGQAIAALAYAIERYGMRTELYADAQIASKKTAETGRTIIRIKDSNEDLDPALVMFAYAHPAFFRGLVIPAMHAHPERFHKPLKIGKTYGTPIGNLSADIFPEGAIYIPSVLRSGEAKAGDEIRTFVATYLESLGLINSFS